MTTPSLQLLQSQRLTDAPNGGGLMTNIVIPDNQPDNLFAPISRINRTDGNVSLRKAFAMARSADTKAYLGTHVIVANPPVNPNVSALIFQTGDWTDEHVDAVNFIESYLVQGPQTRMWPFGQQVKGQRSIIVYQPPSELLPNIGETYVIDNLSVNPNVVQFVRITSITSRVQSFTDSSGPFDLNVITLGISEPLQFTFPGSQAQRFSNVLPPSILCTTNVADAAVYYGVQELQSDASTGDLSVVLNSVFGQLVPSTQGEIPITNASTSAASSVVVAGNRVHQDVRINQSNVRAIYASRGVSPGTLTFQHDSGTIFTDDGAGNLIDPATHISIGTIDYPSGIVSLTIADYIVDASLSFIPAVSVFNSPYTAQQPVTQSTRGYVYTETLSPLPTPGSVVASYRSLGRWYDLKDDGSGTLVGAQGTGAGAVRFDSGTVSVTLGALPDIGSNIVFSWGQQAEYDVRVTDTAIQVPAILLTLTNPAKPTTVSITYLVGGITKTVTDNGHGVLSGDGTGTVDYASGLINLRPNALPNAGSGVSVAYRTNPATVQSLTPSKSGSDLILTLSSAPVSPGSIRFTYDLPVPSMLPAAIGLSSSTLGMVIHDDGSGGLVSDIGGPIAGSSVNYTTGVCTFNPDLVWVDAVVPVYTTENQYFFDETASPPAWTQRAVQVLTSYAKQTTTVAFVNGSAVNAHSTAASASNVTTSESFPSPTVSVDLTPSTVNPIVPGSILFNFAGDTYVDRSGVLYRSINELTNAGITAGLVNYGTGVATLTSWPNGGASTLAINGLVTQLGILPIGSLSARVPGQSVRPSSFFIQANRVSDGTVITATANTNGDWSTSAMTGHIDVTTGFFSVNFGQLVLDSSLTTGDKSEPWYNPANVDGTGHIWRPDEAIPGSIRYSCVVQTFLPLSASVLGLDPVRLPIDGRVQIIRPGDTVVFRNPLVYNVTGTPTASSTITLPRGNLESAIMLDANATQVDTANYTVNLTAGTITMASTIDLSSYTGPYVVTHTQADMVLVTNAEITGQVDFSPALTHDYPHESTFVSSALIFPNAGNLQASYDTLFAQTTWNYDPNHLWDDQVHGTSPVAAFDDVNHPIQVIDRDAITMRWSLIFTSSAGGNIAAEGLGVLGTFSTSTNVAPINDATGNPYFVLDHLGFGGGWSTGNAIRFNTEGAGGPVWFVRSVQAGTSGTTDDGFTTELRWDE